MHGYVVFCFLKFVFIGAFTDYLLLMVSVN